MTDPATIRSLLGGDIDAPGVDALVDEAVSAELDGDFDAFAADLGVESDALAGAVRDMADYHKRRAALSSARDALRSQALEEPSLDEVARRRLVRTALDSSHEDEAGPATDEDRRPVLMRVGTAAVAAALLVVVAIGAVLLSQRSDGDQTASDTLSDGAAEESAAADAGEIEDLGEINASDSLGAVVGDRLGTTLTDPAPQAEGAPAAAMAPDELQQPSGDDAAAELRNQAALTVEECIERLQADFDFGEPVLRATVRVGDTERAVLVYAVSGRTIILSGELPGCTTLPVESFATSE